MQEGVSLQADIQAAAPRYEEPQCQVELVREVQRCESSIGNKHLEHPLATIVLQCIIAVL